MEVHSEGVVLSLSQAEATTLAGQLAAALQLAYGTRQLRPPRLLKEFTGALGRAAGSAKFRKDTQVRAGSGTVRFRDMPSLPSSDQPVRLPVREAANLADVSVGYMRRCCRRGDVQALQGHRGWAVDIASLATWISARRRKEHDSKAAGWPT